MVLNLGTLTATCGISEKMKDDMEFRQFVLDSVSRYCKGDWGELSNADKQANVAAIANGYEILGAYVSEELRAKIWIITEADRSYTTILFPSEY